MLLSEQRANARNRARNLAAAAWLLNVIFAWLVVALLLAVPMGLFLSSLAHAELSEGDILQVEAFATKWERDAATLMTGDVMVGDRRESMGRALGFQRAAWDMRMWINRPIVYTRSTQPRPWPATDQRGTKKLGDLILPGFDQPSKPDAVRPALTPAD